MIIQPNILQTATDIILCFKIVTQPNPGSSLKWTINFCNRWCSCLFQTIRCDLASFGTFVISGDIEAVMEIQNLPSINSWGSSSPWQVKHYLFVDFDFIITVHLYKLSFIQSVSYTNYAIDFALIFSLLSP